MNMQESNEIFYSLRIEDIQTVAEEEIDRTLSKSEIESIKDIIAERINWYDTIAQIIHEKGFS